MLFNKMRRYLSFVAVVAILYSAMPLTVLATEDSALEGSLETKPVTETEPTEEIESTTSTEANEDTQALIETHIVDQPSAVNSADNPLLAEYQAEINRIVKYYLVSIDLTNEEIYESVEAMDWGQYQEARYEISLLDEDIFSDYENSLVTEAEIAALSDANSVFVAFANALDKRASEDTSVSLFDTTNSFFDGGLTITDTSSTGSGTASSYTITVTGGVVGSTTNTITFTNASSVTKELTFTYEVKNANSHSFGSDSGSKTHVMPAGSTVTYTVKSKTKWSGAATLTLSNITFENAASSFNVTVAFDGSLGGITNNGKAFTSGTAMGVDPGSAELIAKPNSNVEFVGWFTPENVLISYDTSYKPELTAALSVKAVFASKTGNGMFLVDNVLYETLAPAITAAGSTKTILLANTGKLTTGNYTIPKGVTLVIPYNSAGTVFGAEDSNDAFTGSGTPTTFRTLIMPSDTTITCNGTINVSGQRTTSGQPNTGVAAGKHGKIVLEGTGTQLNIASGGKMYCYGYVTGSGKVDILSGGTMHELLQLCDWCGGSNADAWNGRKEGTSKMFISSRYYLQNVEAPLRVYAGGSVSCEAVLSISSIKIVSTSKYIASVGSSQGLFLLGDGMYLDRTYDPETDRVKYTTGGTGTGTLGSIQVEVSEFIKGMLTLAGYSLDLNSGSYTLPLTGSMTVEVGSGTTINLGKNIAILPGAEIIIDDGATLNLSSQMYILDIADWTPAMVFGEQTAIPYTAGRGTEKKLTITESGNLTVDGTLNISGSGGVYTSVGITTSETSSDSKDKIITGTGTIIHGGTLSAGALYTGYNDTSYEMKLENGLANLAGKGEMQPFGKSTYYGLGPDHNHYWYETKEVHTPTCTEDGYTIYNCTSGSGYTVAGDPALGHSWGDIAYAWAEDNTTCTASRTCSRDASHTETAKATVTSKVENPTCTEAGSITYTATFSVNWAAAQTKEAAGDAAFDHSWNNVTYAWTDNYSTCTATRVCSRDNSHVETAKATEITSVITDSTCTEAGSTTYTATFNEAWAETSEETVPGDPATGHNYSGEVTKQPTVSTEGEMTYTCGGCGDTYTEPLPNLVGNVIYGTNIRIGDTLDLFFYVTSAKLDSTKSYAAVVVREKDGSTTSEIVPQNEWEAYNSNYVRIRYSGIAAKEMTDTVTVTIYESNNDGTVLGNQISEPATDSIRGYAIRSLKNTASTNAKLRTAVIDMLNYGAAAQNHFGYETDELANTDPTDANGNKAKTIADNLEYASNTVSYSKDNTENNSANFYGTNATLKTDLYLTFYFTGISKDMDAVITYTDHYNQPVTINVDGNEFITATVDDDTTLYGVRAKGIAIADGSILVTCNVNNGTAYATASVEGYIAETIEQNSGNTTLITVCENLMKFITSAYDYFH